MEAEGLSTGLRNMNLLHSIPTPLLLRPLHHPPYLLFLHLDLGGPPNPRLAIHRQDVLLARRIPSHALNLMAPPVPVFPVYPLLFDPLSDGIARRRSANLDHQTLEKRPQAKHTRSNKRNLILNERPCTHGGALGVGIIRISEARRRNGLHDGCDRKVTESYENTNDDLLAQHFPICLTYSFLHVRAMRQVLEIHSLHAVSLVRILPSPKIPRSFLPDHSGPGTTLGRKCCLPSRAGAECTKLAMNPREARGRVRPRVDSKSGFPTCNLHHQKQHRFGTGCYVIAINLYLRQSTIWDNSIHRNSHLASPHPHHVTPFPLSFAPFSQSLPGGSLPASISPDLPSSS